MYLGTAEVDFGARVDIDELAAAAAGAGRDLGSPCRCTARSRRSCDGLAHARAADRVVRPVVTVPADVLTSPCAPIDPRDPAVAQLAADLLATMAVSPGCVGLAANQIGQSARVFSLDVTAHPKTRTHHGVFVLCNPVLEQATRRQRGREGCMSVPDWTGDVRRATRVRVSGRCPSPGSR